MNKLGYVSNYNILCVVQMQCILMGILMDLQGENIVPIWKTQGSLHATFTNRGIKFIYLKHKFIKFIYLEIIIDFI